MSALLSMDSVLVLLLIGWCHAAANDNVRAVVMGSTFEEHVSASNLMCGPADTSTNVVIRCPNEKSGTQGLHSNENSLVLNQASPEDARHIVVYDATSGIILAYFCFVVLSFVTCFAISAVPVYCFFEVFSEDAVRVSFVSKMGEVYRCMQHNLTSKFTGILAQFVNCTLLSETLESVKNATLRFNVPSINASTQINVSTVIVNDPPAALTPDSWDGFTIIIAVFKILGLLAVLAAFLAVFFLAIRAFVVLFIVHRVGMGSHTRSGFSCVANAPDQAASVENPGHEVLLQNDDNDCGGIFDFREDNDIIFSENGEVDLSQKKEDMELRIPVELPVDDVDNVLSSNV